MVGNADMSENLPLAAKGRFMPPPVLDEPMQALSVSIQSWPGVIAATHWHLNRPNEVNGADFYFGADEVGHIHLDGEVHLATSSDLREALVSERLARPFPYYRSWVETSIRSEKEARHAEWLFRLNYDRVQGTPIVTLLTKIKDYGSKQR
jgi:hypothetical protein